MSCNGNCNDEPIIKNFIGEKGTDGTNGWVPILAIVNDGSRRVFQIVSWTGGTGAPPSSTNQFIGSSGIVNSASLAADVRGATGLDGAAGSNGLNGWSPLFAVVQDPGDTLRYVLQIVDWTGGQGSKPSVINQYIGALGIVNTPGAAVNIRGAQGLQGPAGTDSLGQVKISAADTTYGYIFDKLLVSGTMTKQKNNAGGNESITLSSRSPEIMVAHSNDNNPIGGGAYISVFGSGYTTPDDGITRNYIINYSHIAYMGINDGTGRTVTVHLALYVGGLLTKETSITIFSKADASRSDSYMALHHAMAIPPNMIIDIMAKKSGETPSFGNDVRMKDKSLTIIGF